MDTSDQEVTTAGSDDQARAPYDPTAANLVPWPCPACGGRVEWEPACHTYATTGDDGTERFMVCIPCDSAVEFSCYEWLDDEVYDADSRFVAMREFPNGECRWSWRLGLNPRNPRAVENAAMRPRWANEAIERFGLRDLPPPQAEQP